MTHIRNCLLPSNALAIYSCFHTTTWFLSLYIIKAHSDCLVVRHRSCRYAWCYRLLRIQTARAFYWINTPSNVVGTRPPNPQVSNTILYLQFYPSFNRLQSISLSSMAQANWTHKFFSIIYTYVGVRMSTLNCVWTIAGLTQATWIGGMSTQDKKFLWDLSG